MLFFSHALCSPPCIPRGWAQAHAAHGFHRCCKPATTTVLQPLLVAMDGLQSTTAMVDFFFCYNHVLFLLELAHVFATTHPPNFCYQVIFATTDEPFCYYRFDLLLLSVFVDFCYIHLLFFLSFSLQPYFDFAGTEDIFCYIHPRRCCSTAAMAFFLLQPSRIFATTGDAILLPQEFLLLPESSRKHQEFLLPPFVFVGTILKICYHRLLILLEPAFFASVSAMKAGGVLVRRQR